MRICFVMDPIESINLQKDSTLAMIFCAKRLGWQTYITEPERVSVQTTVAQKVEVWASVRGIEFINDQIETFELGARQQANLGQNDIVFTRQDPPVDVVFSNLTHCMQFLKRQGVLVVNDPAGVAIANEKLTALQFPNLAPPSLVTRERSLLQSFLEQHEDIVIKPLDGMGGQGIFRLRLGDQNFDSVIELLTQNGRLAIIAQQYIPEIQKLGDKRILMVCGEPIPYALARIPQAGALRGNLAAGGTGEGRALTVRDQAICAQVGPWLLQHGLYFVGLDVIGDYLTEVNVTSPTCVRELDTIYNLDICRQLLLGLATFCHSDKRDSGD